MFSLYAKKHVGSRIRLSAWPLKRQRSCRRHSLRNCTIDMPDINCHWQGAHRFAERYFMSLQGAVALLPIAFPYFSSFLSTFGDL